MKTKIINKSGNWDFPWTEKLKNSLRENTENTTVGQHLILETEIFKVWSIHLEVGKSLPFHKHDKPYFYTIKTEGRSRSFYADGSIKETTYQKDDIKYFNNLNKDHFFIHNLKNIGSTTLVFTTVEFKI